jgi:hypothetical protein
MAFKDDNIETLVNEIRHDRTIMNCFKNKPFTAKFLQKVGKIFETNNFTVTKSYLQSEEERRLREEATALLCVLEKFHKYKEIENDRAVGRCIIRNLNTILKEEGKPCRG